MVPFISSARTGLRSRMSSPSGFVSVGLVVSLLVGAAAVAVGQGASRILLELGDGAAWLPTDPRGTVTLVDGASGRPTAEVRLASGDGSSLQVVERDGQVFVLDTATGVLTRIDASTFEAPRAVGTEGSASRVLVGDGVAFVVDAESGVVRVLDGMSLEPLGDPVQVSGGIVSAATDADGVAFLADAQGNVVVVDRKGRRGSWQVASCGVQLSAVAGSVFASAPCSGQVRRLGGDGPAEPVGVPGLAGAEGVLAPEQVLGEALAFVVPNGLAVLDTSDGSVSQVPLPRVPGAVWGAPVVSGGLVYLPETRSGALFVLERGSGVMRQKVQVTQGAPFLLSEDSGIVFVNDPASNTALTVDDNGTVREVSKYDQEVAALAKEPVQTPVEPAAPVTPPQPGPPSQSGPPAPGPQPGPPAQVPGPPSGAPDPGNQGPQDPQPPVEPEPPAEPERPAPGQPVIVSATAGNKSVTVEFAAPSDGGTVTEYALRVSSGGTQVSPRRVDERGPTTFVAAFERCQSVELVVVAEGPDGSTASAPMAASTCARAGEVQSVRAVADGVDAVTASWAAPTAGADPFTYEARLGDGPWTQVGDGLAVEFPVTGPGTYTVTVVATGADGERGAPVTSAPVQIAYRTAGKVTGLQVDAQAPRRVVVTWSPPDAGTGPFSYRVRLAGSGQGWQPVSGTSHRFTELEPSTDYTAEVQAKGRDGQWGASAEKRVSTPAPPLPDTVGICENVTGSWSNGSKTYSWSRCGSGAKFRIQAQRYSHGSVQITNPVYQWRRTVGGRTEYVLSGVGPSNSYFESGEGDWTRGALLGWVSNDPFAGSRGIQEFHQDVTLDEGRAQSWRYVWAGDGPGAGSYRARGGVHHAGG